MRASLLAHDPQTGPVTIEMLVGTATAIEQESVRRYEQLERVMQRRGEFETAAAFRRMLEEEREHVESIARWAHDLGVPVPDNASFEWELPPDLSTSWDAIAGSALLTPYRAFAIAAENEQRAFAFYSYLAAQASDRTVAEQAERLAAEELQHAARVRQWRREAYHREREARGAHAQPAESAEVVRAARSPDALRSFIASRHASIVEHYRALLARLRTLGDEAGAALLEAFIAAHPTDAGPTDTPEADELERIARVDDALHLIVAAQRPLEQLGESLEQILSTSRDEVFELAEQAATDIVAWLARLTLHAERIDARSTRPA